MITLSRLAKAYGERTLFENASLQLVPGSRYGLVGANGSGKTTLLRIFAGDESPSDGEVRIPKHARLGVLRQDRFASDDAIVLELVMQGDEPAYAAWKAREELAKVMEGSVEHATRVAEADEAMRMHDGYTLEGRASVVLSGLGIAADAQRGTLSELSGGFKLRVLLAQLLVAKNDILLLDEPTNHLDIVSIRWLEKFLSEYAGCVIVISHDRRFLDNVVTHIVDIDFGTLTLYPGNYSHFEVEKVATRERQEVAIERQEKIIADKRAFVERFGAKASKAKQAQSRLKQIEKIEVDTLAASSRRAPHFGFEPRRSSGKDVLNIDRVSKSYDGREVLNNVSLTVRRGDRIGIVGANGLGKSTLVKIAMGVVEADSGKADWGFETHVGYFPQDHHDALANPKQSVLDFVWDVCPAEPTTVVRGELGKMLFSGNEVDKPLGVLSGGEAARAIFCRMALEHPNVLVLDEPTNHLDIESIDALAAALEHFEGTVLFVSHDRAFVSAVATRIVEVRADGVRDFMGTYAEFVEESGDDHLDAVLAASKARKEARALASAGDDQAGKVQSWEDEKRRRNRAKQLPKQRDAILKKIEERETRRKEIARKFAEPDFYTKASREEVTSLEEESAAIDVELETLMVEWERIEGELASLEG